MGNTIVCHPPNSFRELQCTQLLCFQLHEKYLISLTHLSFSSHSFNCSYDSGSLYFWKYCHLLTGKWKKFQIMVFELAQQFSEGLLKGWAPVICTHTESIIHYTGPLLGFFSSVGNLITDLCLIAFVKLHLNHLYLPPHSSFEVSASLVWECGGLGWVGLMPAWAF